MPYRDIDDFPKFQPQDKKLLECIFPCIGIGIFAPKESIFRELDPLNFQAPVGFNI